MILFDIFRRPGAEQADSANARRTGTGTRGNPRNRNPHREKSFAQLIANYFHIKVRAYYRKTNYKYVLVSKEERNDAKNGIEDEIRAAMKRMRDGGYYGRSFSISAEYEALFHEGSGYSNHDHTLSEIRGSRFIGQSPVAEGVDNPSGGKAARDAYPRHLMPKNSSFPRDYRVRLLDRAYFDGPILRTSIFTPM